MADNVETQGAEEQQIDPKIELAQHMAIALGTEMPKEQQAASQTAEEAAAAAAQAQQAAPVDYFGQIKEKFGYQSHEDAIKEIEALRAFKATPTVDIPFENEDSEKLFKAVTKGDRATVYQILKKEQEINQYLTAEVTPDTAADIVKLGMQLKYKDLSPAEIDYKFKKTFAPPPKPVQDVNEEPEDYNVRLSAWQELADDKKMDLLIEAKLAKPELEAAKSKLVFPDIVSTEDEGYVQYKKALEQQNQSQAEIEKTNAAIIAAYKALTPKEIGVKLNFIDEPNKINFDFEFEPDPESFSKTMPMVLDTEAFFNSFNDKDGNPDRKAFLEAVYFAKNKDRVILEAIKQGKNAAIKAMLPDNQGGIVRQLVQTPGEPSELDKAMAAAGIRRQ